MKKYFILAFFLMFIPVTSFAQSLAYTRGETTIFAGPGFDYPQILSLTSIVPLGVYGCLPDYSWCDISYMGSRGWVMASHLGFDRNGRILYIQDYSYNENIPILDFSLGTYWGLHYENRPWYQKYRYDHDFHEQNHMIPFSNDYRRDNNYRNEPYRNEPNDEHHREDNQDRGNRRENNFNEDNHDRGNPHYDNRHEDNHPAQQHPDDRHDSQGNVNKDRNDHSHDKDENHGH